MIRFAACLLSFASIYIAGCATKPSLPDDAKAALLNLKSEKVAVSYTLVQKRINFSEVLFRGLWLETKTSSKDFSGAWSPDGELTSYIVDTLTKQGYRAESIHSAVQDKSIVESHNSDWGRRVLTNSYMEHPGIKGVKLLPRPEFFVRPDIATESASLYNELRLKGFKYFVEFTAMDIYGNAPGYGMVIVDAAPNVRIIDLATGKALWSKQLVHSELYQLGGDLSRLETDQMSKAKEGLQVGIAKMKFADIFEVH